MGTSGNPAKKATTTKRTAAKKTAAKRPAKKATSSPTDAQLDQLGVEVSDISAFKKKREGRLLQLPSGLVVRAMRVDLQTFIARGSVPNPLMTVVQEALAKGDKANIPEMVGLEDGSVDLEMVNEMMEIVDSVLVETVLAPKVHPLPAEGEEPNDELLYVNDVDPEDKMFIFQWAVGGTDDVERFREEAGADLASLAQG